MTSSSFIISKYILLNHLLGILNEVVVRLVSIDLGDGEAVLDQAMA